MRSAMLAGAVFVVATWGAGAPESLAGAPDFEHVHALAFEASGQGLWLGAHTGFYRSEDGGRTWSAAALPAGRPDVMAVASIPIASEAGKRWAVYPPAR